MHLFQYNIYYRFVRLYNIIIFIMIFNILLEILDINTRIIGTHFTHASVTHHVFYGEHVHNLSFVHTAFGVTCNTNHNNIII